MQHTVLPVVLEALHGVEVGRPQPAQGRLLVVSLVIPQRAVPAGRSWPAGVAGVAELDWREMHPLRPGCLQVRNPLPRPAMVAAGTVVDGGMSARAVTRSVLVPPGEAIPVGVEPLGARWWDEGPVRRRGRLGAVAAALLLQALHGSRPYAWSARTAFWTLHDDDPARGLGDRPAGGSAAGWALVLDGDVVAAWLPDQRRVPTHPRAAPGPVPGDMGPRELIASLSVGLGRGDLAAHVAGHDVAVRDLIVVPRDLRLVDHVTAALPA